MQYELSLTYSESLIRYAVTRFWWRVVGFRFIGTIFVLTLCLAFFVNSGDTSWVVGALGAVIALGVLFTVALYVVHYHNSLRKFRAMGNPHATFVASDDNLSMSSKAGLTTLPWSSVSELWQFPDCWLLLFSKAQFVTLPLVSIGAEARAFIVQQVQHAGGKVG